MLEYGLFGCETCWSADARFNSLSGMLSFTWAVLSDAMVAQLQRASRPWERLRRPPRERVEAGMPDQNIVSACHGPNAEGVGAIPRLGGLSYLYLKRKLEQWGEGYHMTAQFPMPQVSVKLSPDTIEALASYLSFVR
jgi:cytochrome c553